MIEKIYLRCSMDECVVCEVRGEVVVKRGENERMKGEKEGRGSKKRVAEAVAEECDDRVEGEPPEAKVGAVALVLVGWPREG